MSRRRCTSVRNGIRCTRFLDGHDEHVGKGGTVCWSSDAGDPHRGILARPEEWGMCQCGEDMSSPVHDIDEAPGGGT